MGSINLLLLIASFMSESFFGMTISSCYEILSISSYILSALLKKFGSLELLETQIIKISKSISDFNSLGPYAHAM